MKPIKFAAILIIFVLPATAFGQKKYFHRDTFDHTFIKCDNPPTFGKDNLALQSYFSEKLEKRIGKVRGRIEISVLIDTLGKVLCQWISNDSNLNLEEEKLDTLVDSMPNWNCGLQNGHKINSVGIIVLAFARKNLEATYHIGEN